MIEKIAHITDMHLDEMFPLENHAFARKRFDNVLKDIENKNISHIICTGDIGEGKGVQYFFEQLKNKSFSITLGNHDKFIEVFKHYNLGADYNSQKIYSSTQKEYYKLIYLDSSEGTIDNKQLIWLEKELISTKPIIIFIHHPLIALNLKVDEIGKLKNRQEVISLLTKVNNEITIYCGHYHMESSLTYKNIAQYITPAIAFQIKKNTNTIEIDTTISGYRIIHIEKHKVSSTVELLDNAN